METVVSMSDAGDNEAIEGDKPNKVILLPIQNRHSSNARYPISAERIALLLQESGYKGSVVETETRKFVESSAEGWKFRVYFSMMVDQRKRANLPLSCLALAGA